LALPGIAAMLNQNHTSVRLGKSWKYAIIRIIYNLRMPKSSYICLGGTNPHGKGGVFLGQ